MRTEYFIAMDTHCRTTDACIKTARGKLVRRVHLATGIPQLRELIESVPRPRRLCFEESSMAGWLHRNLKEYVDELIVCDPRRNAHIAKDGDKDDPIDAEKLNDLYRSNHLKAVH
jgi:transposase